MVVEDITLHEYHADKKSVRILLIDMICDMQHHRWLSGLTRAQMVKKWPSFIVITDQ